MPRVSVHSVVQAEDPLEVLRQVVDFARWPGMSDAVQAVRSEPAEQGATSYWEVVFREGVLLWSQRDALDPDALTAHFELIEGDPLVWNGAWTTEASAAGVVVRMNAEFDLGMPSLGHVLDPMAIEALEDAVESVLRGLFGEQTRVDFGGGEETDEAKTMEGAA